MLLRAFAFLTEKWPDLRLVIIGDGPLKSQLASMAHDMVIASKVSIPGGVPLAAGFACHGRVLHDLLYGRFAKRGDGSNGSWPASGLDTLR